MLFFIFALMLFVPKQSFYYLLEQNLKKFDLIISNETLADRIISLKIKHLDVTLKGIETLSIKEADITLLGLYNEVALHNVQLSSLVESYLPAKIERVKIEYTLLHPLQLQAEGEGLFGDASVVVDIVEKKVTLLLQPSPMMLKRYRKSLRMLKKSKNGEYIYEKSL